MWQETSVAVNFQKGRNNFNVSHNILTVGIYRQVSTETCVIELSELLYYKIVYIMLVVSIAGSE